MSATKQELERQVFRRTIENRTILRAEVGSTAHGINLQDGQDDLDEMGICIEPYSMAMGLTPFEQLIYRTAVERTGDHNARSEKGDLDLTIYSLRKYVRLALKGNPSILALLFVSDGLIRTKDRFGDELRFRSSFFVSKRAGHAFLGYLIAQRQRLMHERGGKHGARTNEFQPLDLKYAAHMVRLGLQGIELMNTGHISIPMDFKKGSQIRAIRNGSMTEQEIMEIGGNLEQELRDAIDVSTFPDEPMKEEAEAWMLKVYQQSWHNHGDFE